MVSSRVMTDILGSKFIDAILWTTLWPIFRVQGYGRYFLVQDFSRYVTVQGDSRFHMDHRFCRYFLVWFEKNADRRTFEEIFFE